MATRMKDAKERETRTNIPRDVTFRSGVDEITARPRAVTPPPSADDSMDSSETAVKFSSPAWLKGMMPIRWPASNACGKTAKHGQNCCLFFPLGYCRDTDVVNGFCVFHLRAVFNLVYQTDCVYMMNADRKPTMSQRTACYIAEPQVIDDEYTTVFPVVELMPNEVQLQDIKLHNLSKHLQMHGTQNWERIYANHVNYLYRLYTLYSPEQAAKIAVETRVDQLTHAQLFLHWGLWNEYYSKIIADNRVDLYPFYVSEERNDIRPLPANECTTITQMIARLFSLPYTNYNSPKFYSTISSYGIYAKAHFAYANNLCAIGTHCTKGNLPCIGNVATLCMMRTDTGTCQPNTVHYSRLSECGAKYCVPSRVNLEAPSLGTSVVATSRYGPVTNPATA